MIYKTNEKMPNMNKEVLVLDTARNWSVLKWSDWGYWISGAHKYSPQCFTHWTELPEKPEIEAPIAADDKPREPRYSSFSFKINI